MQFTLCKSVSQNDISSNNQSINHSIIRSTRIIAIWSQKFVTHYTRTRAHARLQFHNLIHGTLLIPRARARARVCVYFRVFVVGWSIIKQFTILYQRNFDVVIPMLFHLYPIIILLANANSISVFIYYFVRCCLIRRLVLFFFFIFFLRTRNANFK